MCKISAWTSRSLQKFYFKFGFTIFYFLQLKISVGPLTLYLKILHLGISHLWRLNSISTVNDSIIQSTHENNVDLEICLHHLFAAYIIMLYVVLYVMYVVMFICASPLRKTGFLLRLYCNNVSIYSVSIVTISLLRNVSTIASKTPALSF